MNGVKQVRFFNFLEGLRRLIEFAVSHLTELILEIEWVNRLNLSMLDALVKRSQLEFVLNAVPLLTKIVPLEVRVHCCFSDWIC